MPYLQRRGVNIRVKMRLLLLVFNLVISVSVFGYAGDTSATVKSKKISHQHAGSQKLSTGKSKRNKSSKHLMPIKRIYRPTDVWERIRLGMQMNTQIDMFRPMVSGGINTVASDIDQLLKTSAVQVRLYRFQHFKSDVLNNMLKQPSMSIMKDTPEIHTAQNNKNNSAPVLNIGKGNVDASGVGENIKVAADISPRCAPLAADAELKSSTAMKKSVFINTVFVQPSTYAPDEKSDFPLRKASLKHRTLTSPCVVSPGKLSTKTTALLEIEPIFNETVKIVDPLPENGAYARINKQVAWFTKRPDYLRQVSERARPYLYHIVDELSKHKLPLELALLPIVESAYQATAQSPKSAAGLWQFMPGTGREFNLKQDDYYDDRLDVSASTQAAIRFLSQLNTHFKGDWLLALAAYNSGQGRVDAAIRQNIAQGLPSDYWSLSLPEETKNYVPRLLALATIFANPARYHLNVKPINNAPYFVTINIDQQAEILQLANKELRTVAELANLSYEQFSQLNPGYLNATLASAGPFNFVMPAVNANQLQQQLTILANAEVDDQMPSPFLQTQLIDSASELTAASDNAVLNARKPI